MPAGCGVSNIIAADCGSLNSFAGAPPPLMLWPCRIVTERPSGRAVLRSFGGVNVMVADMSSLSLVSSE